VAGSSPRKPGSLLVQWSKRLVAALHTAKLQLRPSNPSALVAGSSPRKPAALLSSFSAKRNSPANL